jgi:uncharacterized protein
MYFYRVSFVDFCDYLAYTLSMWRKALDILDGWLDKKNRKPLILRGARQVGKSTLVRLFALRGNLDLMEINLEIHKELDEVFGELNIDRIMLSLQAVTGKRFNRSSLLFLDEIQATPNGLAALRYFYENKPEMAVIAAGSLLEFALSRHGYSMPVGRVEYMYLEPMTFSEFLLEIDPAKYEILREFQYKKPLPDIVHTSLLSRQREFMLIGGMPEAVSVFCATNSLDEVTAVQNSICSTYLDDFSKYAQERQLTRLQQIFRTVPTIIGNKLKYTNLLPEERSTATRELLDLLIKAQVVREASSCDADGTPLAAGADINFRKLFFLDIGLAARLLQIDSIEMNTLNDRQLVNEGPLAEQFIGQHLTTDETMQTKSALYYWANKGKDKRAEIDFIISRGRLIVPIEVKSGRSGTLKSLHFFMYRKQKILAFRFDMNQPSVNTVSTEISLGSTTGKVEYTLYSLPLYAVEKLPEILDEYRRGDQNSNASG